jgi:hypothetical protein
VVPITADGRVSPAPRERVPQGELLPAVSKPALAVEELLQGDVEGRAQHRGTTRREREILEHAVHTIAEQASKADDFVDEAIEVGRGRSDPLVVHAKMLRLELLKVKADLERELVDFSLNCSECGLDVRWVSSLGIQPGHWAHAEPAPHGEPAL